MNKDQLHLPLTSIIKEIAEVCLKKSISIVTAESCTAGGVAFQLTSLAGSSAWFDRGFVTYSNLSKIEMLAVNKASIAQYGAVSREVVIEMAEGAIKKSNAQMSLAITGIAGPSGGDQFKPVGTCWFGWSNSCFKTYSKSKLFDGDREAVRHQAINFSLVEFLNLIQANLL